MKKLFKLFLVLTLLIQFTACGKSEKLKDTNLVKQTIKGDGFKTEVYRYTPTLYEFKGSMTPLLVVLSQERFTDDNIQDILLKGFKKICDRESCSVVFINPSGDHWTYDDKKIVDLVMGNSTEQYMPNVSTVSGVNKKGQFYCSHFRKYIFAIGDIKEFVENNLVGDYYIEEWSSNSGGYGAGNVFLASDYTRDDVYDGFDSIKYQTRRFLEDGNSYIDSFIYYDQHNIECNQYSYKASSTRTISYIEYKKADNEEQQCSLVVLFHGRGSSPFTYIEQTKWPLLIKDNNLRVLIIEGPYDIFYSKKVSHNITADTQQLIQNYVDKNNIDRKNIFLSGFSMGAYRTLALANLAESNDSTSNFYKAIAPCNFVSTNKIEFTNSLPTFITIGDDDFYHYLPKENKECAAFIKQLAALENIDYSCDSTIDNIWGYNFSSCHSIQSSNYKININRLSSNLVLADVENMSHNVCPEMTNLIWQFFQSID